jgi:ATP adenylyltransferase
VIERLWSGWRSAYVAGDAVESRVAFDTGRDGASVFTRLLESGLPDDETHIVRRGPRCFAIMNAYPYTNGHLIVLPYREVPDLLDLDAAESAELWATVTEAVDVVRRAFSPDGVNVGLNLGRASGGSVPSHLHVHVVPRWTGDTNFMASIANTQTIPESLAVSARKVREAWSTPAVSS